MSGYLRQRAPGHWEISHELAADPLTSKRRRATLTVHGTRKDAERELRRRLVAVEAGLHVDPHRITVGEARFRVDVKRRRHAVGRDRDIVGEQAVRGRRIKHDGTYNSGGYLRKGVEASDDPHEAPGAWHPAVCRHPVTGAPSLYLGRRRNSYVEGLTLAESEAAKKLKGLLTAILLGNLGIDRDVTDIGTHIHDPLGRKRAGMAPGAVVDENLAG